MAEEKKGSKHSVLMEKRERVAITGVIDVVSFDEETVIADTEMGALILRGVNMHVSRLNLDTGDLEIDGEIVSLNYEEQNGYSKGKASFISKLFR